MSMSFKMRMVVGALAACAALVGQSVLAATTVVVGPSTCQPGRVHYPTIGTAISAVSTGSTVLVCPGTYPEQVAIAQPLTLKGVTDGTGNAAVITVPSGGLVVNAFAPTEFGAVTAQILVQNTSGVLVSNLTVDGTGSGCLYPSAVRQSGIVAYNVGNTQIANLTVRNEQTGCASGEGIIADSSTITINGNNFHNIDRTAIIVAGGTALVETNSVQNAYLYGVGLYYTNKSVVTGNSIANLTEAGIWVQNSNSSIVTKNTFLSSPGSIGIYLTGSSANSVSANSVGDCNYGIALQFSGNNVVQSNRFSQVAFDGLYEDTSLGGNIMTKNTVNEANYGIFTDGSVGGDTLTPNSLFNTLTTIDPNPGTIVMSDQL